ncbi:hypothetical protein HanXRQr2_Chr14g0667191 [Helianthus annuus]|uniref:Uncharacterized protein n=1 Tax=Helianthus annuus TaxID=4232 RepID=A0A9K3EDN6_HELAN|nr:hypothetical protein HanXRQr2_Chr14g0667191 [Helianthus annuus]KAJ0842313.1 hypothetical protein HanPSC8_Chr14g0640241 [Helianthus annuus]
MDGGIPPVRSLLDKAMTVISDLELKSFGIFPDRLLSFKLKSDSFGQLDMLAGISPVNKFLGRDNTCNRCN